MRTKPRRHNHVSCAQPGKTNWNMARGKLLWRDGNPNPNPNPNPDRFFGISPRFSWVISSLTSPGTLFVSTFSSEEVLFISTKSMASALMLATAPLRALFSSQGGAGGAGASYNALMDTVPAHTLWSSSSSSSSVVGSPVVVLCIRRPG